MSGHSKWSTIKRKKARLTQKEVKYLLNLLKKLQLLQKQVAEILMVIHA